MRAREFLRLIEDDLSTLKNKVIKSIETTDDATLLDKIYSALNRTNITQRIGAALNQNDRDIKGYIDEIVEVIVNTPGRYEDKLLFAEGLDKGYVNIKEMLSGKRVHFEDLLTPNKTNVPISFIVSVFNGLKLIGANEQKGPGEFALAALSPDISIFGAGDLKIGNHNIEVKAAAGEKSTSGGRLGSTGFLQHQRVPEIINSYMPEGFKVDPSENLNLREFEQLLKKANLDPTTTTQFAEELFGYIFEGKDWADISPLVNAMVSGTDLYKPYTIVAYNAYRGRPENTKFDGVMLMSFPLQELKYYDDPEKMYDDLYTPGVKLISANKEWASRGIVPSVGLRPEKVEKVEKIKKGTSDEDVVTWADKYARFIVAKNRNRTPGLADEITNFLLDLYQNKKLKFSDPDPQIYGQFPELRQKTEVEKSIDTALNDFVSNLMLRNKVYDKDLKSKITLQAKQLIDSGTPINQLSAELIKLFPQLDPTQKQQTAEVPASIQNQTRTLGSKIPMGSA